MTAPAASALASPVHSHEECACGEPHLDIGKRIDVLHAPFMLLDHQPLATVPYAEVQELIQEGLLSECDGDEIYRHQGHGIATLCSDPSLYEFKQRAVQRRGNFASFSLPGIGLRFDPESATFQPELLHEIEKFLAKTKGHFDLGKAFVIGAHYPCGYAEGKDGEKLTLRQTVEHVAAGACYVRDKAGHKVIATIFITTMMAEGHMNLLWYHVKKNKKRPIG
ncbi:MAG: hypothetical protein AAB519_01830 [Patescibacteria group bacterium]